MIKYFSFEETLKKETEHHLYKEKIIPELIRLRNINYPSQLIELLADIPYSIFISDKELHITDLFDLNSIISKDDINLNKFANNIIYSGCENNTYGEYISFYGIHFKINPFLIITIGFKIPYTEDSIYKNIEEKLSN